MHFGPRGLTSIVKIQFSEICPSPGPYQCQIPIDINMRDDNAQVVGSREEERGLCKFSAWEQKVLRLPILAPTLYQEDEDEESGERGVKKVEKLKKHDIEKD